MKITSADLFAKPTTFKKSIRRFIQDSRLGQDRIVIVSEPIKVVDKDLIIYIGEYQKRVDSKYVATCDVSVIYHTKHSTLADYIYYEPDSPSTALANYLAGNTLRGVTI